MTIPVSVRSSPSLLTVGESHVYNSLSLPLALLRKRESYMREERRDETVIYLRGHFRIFSAFTLPQTLRTPTFQPLTPESFTFIKAAKHTVLYKKKIIHRQMKVFIIRVR